MSTFINTIDELGDEVVFKQIVERTIIQFKDNLLTNVGKNAFYECSALTSVNLPNVTSFWENSFYNCSGLTMVDFVKADRIQSGAFGRCTSLKSFIIRSKDVMSHLDSIYAFISSGISNGTCYFYVPRVFLSDTDSTKDYRRATNWSTYANQFRALEDYTVDGTVTGELDLSKI